MENYQCAQCEKSFRNYRSDKSKYCSKACKDIGLQVNHEHVCGYCTKVFITKKKSSKYCSFSCAGKVNVKLIKNRSGGASLERHWNWGGGSNKTTQGYIETHVTSKKRKLQHRLVMEQYLGRELGRTEQVHHINGDKTDNSITNLVVMTPAEHTRLHLKKRWHNIDISKEFSRG